MRLGWLEIVIIIIAVILILAVTRIVRAGRTINNTGETSTEMSVEQTTGKPTKMTPTDLPPGVAPPIELGY